jgi:hypothetical protein
MWKPQSQKGEGENPIGLRPRNTKACHNFNVALLQCVAQQRTQRTMKSSGKLFRENEGEVEELSRKKNKGRG